MTDLQCAGCGYYRPRDPWATPECRHELYKRLTARQREAIETGELKCTWHMTGCALRPPELDIEGCTIRTSYDTVGRVETITPFRGDPGWMLRPLAPGWTIEYRDQRGDLCFINEVFVEDGQIFAHPWRDQIEVVHQVARQMRMF